MTPTAMTTAAIITPISSAIPTAVITESRLKTMSRSKIWTITDANPAAATVGTMGLLALELLVDLERRLSQEEQTTADEDQVPARELLADDREPRFGEPDHP